MRIFSIGLVASITLLHFGHPEAQAQRPKVAPEPKPMSSNSVEDKLRTIIIPSIRFEEASIGEALGYLRRKAIEFDPEDAHERRGKGIHIVLIDDSDEVFPWKTIDLNLTNVSLGTALKAVGSAMDMAVHVEGNGVVVGRKPAPDVLQTGRGGLPLRRALEKANLSTVFFDEITWEEGIFFWSRRASTEAPKGSPLRANGLNAVLLESTETLTLSLQEIPLSDVLRYAAAQSGVKVRVEQHAIVIGTKLPPEPEPGEPKGIEKKMREIVVPAMDLSLATAPESAAFLATMADGMTIEAKGDAWEDSIHLQLKNVPLWEAVRYVAMVADAKVEVTETGVVLVPKR